MNQYVHVIIAMMLSELTFMFFWEKYFLNDEDYEFMQSGNPLRLVAHGMVYGIFLYIFM